MNLIRKYKSNRIYHKDHTKPFLILLSLSLSFFFIYNTSAQTVNPTIPKSSDKSQNIIQPTKSEINTNKDSDTEKDYRRILSKDQNNIPANYNLGNHLYKNGYLYEALPKYENAIKRAKSKSEKHKAYHNIGNIYMNNEAYDKAADAYLKALINNPDDEETRYNYVLAKSLIKKQKNPKNDNKKDQDNKDDKNENDKNNQDDKKDQKQDQDKDQKDKDQDNNDKKDESKDEDKKNQEQDKDDKNSKKNKKKQSQLSPEQIKYLLEAMDKEEQKVQEKMNQEPIKGTPLKSEKDW